MAFVRIPLKNHYPGYSGYVLKFYLAGTTTTATPMYTDYTGATSSKTFKLNSNGFTQTSGDAQIFPYISDSVGRVKGVLFPTQAAADANDTSGALFVFDNLNPGEGSGGTATTVHFERLTATTVSQTAFTTTNDFGTATGSLRVYVNGVRLLEGIDYTKSPTNNFTLTTGVAIGTDVDTEIYSNINLADAQAQNVTYLPTWTGASTSDVRTRLSQVIFASDASGVDLTGATSSLVAVANLLSEAVSTGKMLVFNPGTYLLDGQLSGAADNIQVYAVGATFVFDGAATGFVFGTSATDSLPNNKGLRWVGGTFQNADSTDVVNRSYLKLQGMEEFYIGHVRMEEVSNGGIELLSGCHHGTLDDIKIPSKSSFTTIRGIWLNGSDATDYASNLVDNSTIARNATALPVGGIKDITIKHCRIEIAAYGIYLMNARECTIRNNYIDTDNGTLRNITINTYSPYTKILNNTLKAASTSSSKGILVTQYSHDTKIYGNHFIGDWGLNYCIHATYLANCDIQRNHFLASNPVCIGAEMGANGTVQNNNFGVEEGNAKTAGDRCMRIYAIGLTEAATSGYGDTATVLKGWTFKDNEIHTRNYGVQVTQQSSNDTSNEPGIDAVVVKDNEFYDWDDVSNSEEYPLFIDSIASPANTVRYACFDNITYPASNGFEERNRADDANGAAVDMMTTDQVEARGSGTWLPVVCDNDLSSGEGQTAQTQSDNTYIRITDKLCFISCQISMASLGTLTTTHAVQITGLPFTANNLAGQQCVFEVADYSGLSITAGVSLKAYAVANTKTIRLVMHDGAAASSDFLLSNLTASGTLKFSGMYQIESLA